MKSVESALLNKIQRKQKLNKNVENWDQEGKGGMIYYWQLLRKIDDQKLQKIIGTDAALYVFWLKYAANFFGVITIMNFGFGLMYIQGEPKPADDIRNNEGQSLLSLVTIINVSGSKLKVIGCFFQCMIVVASLILLMIFKYITKYQKLP